MALRKGTGKAKARYEQDDAESTQDEQSPAPVKNQPKRSRISTGKGKGKAKQEVTYEAGVYLTECITGQYLRIGAFYMTPTLLDAFESLKLTTTTTVVPDDLKNGHFYLYGFFDPEFVKGLPKSEKGSVAMVLAYSGIFLIAGEVIHLGTTRRLKKIFGDGNFTELGGLDSMDSITVEEFRELLRTADGQENPTNVVQDEIMGIMDDRLKAACLAAFQHPDILEYVTSSLSFKPEVQWPYRPSVTNHQSPFSDLLRYLSTWSKDGSIKTQIESLTPEKHAELVSKYRSSLPTTSTDNLELPIPPIHPPSANLPHGYGPPLFSDRNPGYDPNFLSPSDASATLGHFSAQSFVPPFASTSSFPFATSSSLPVSSTSVPPNGAASSQFHSLPQGSARATRRSSRQSAQQDQIIYNDAHHAKSPSPLSSPRKRPPSKSNVLAPSPTKKPRSSAPLPPPTAQDDDFLIGDSQEAEN